MASHIPHKSRPPSPISVHANHSDTVSIGAEPFILPPQRETLYLIELYFSTTGILFPYIEKEGFLQTYRQLNSTNIVSVRRPWLGLLNIVLAMATSVNTGYDVTLSARERTSKSDVYFRRAFMVCDRQIRHGTSVEIVQLLLLMSQYLQGSERSIETWNIHGLAVKAAYQLGLHSSKALQQTLSMTMGRPISIPEQFVKIELPQTLPGSQLEDETSAQFFTATITLYQIMADVLDVLYGSNLGCEDHVDVFETASCLLKCEQRFFSWQRDLPKQISLIRLEDLEQEPNEFKMMRLRIILTLRFLNLRILAHRPILCMYLENLGASPVDTLQLATLRQVGANSVRLCVQSANTILSITSWASKHNSPSRHLLGAWWFSLYYVKHILPGHHHGRNRGPRVTQVVNEEISKLAPYAGIILTVILVVFFLVRYYVFEKFLLRKIYKSTFTNLDEVKRRGFINHHIAATAKIIMLVVAGYPFLAVVFGKDTVRSPFGSSKVVTMGDILLVINQVFVAMYIFELIFRATLSPVAVAHHIGAVVIAATAVAISLNWQHQQDATIEFLLCYVWGMFDVIAEFWPHVAIILYRMYPTDHDYLRKVFLSAGIITCSGTVIETIVVFWLWGSLWHRWTLPFKIVTPILHVIFSAAQLWGVWNFYKMWLRQKMLLQNKEKNDVENSSSTVSSGTRAEDSRVQTRTEVPKLDQ
ncbi:hypothetical protein yc1106_01401 [Curvularia clavata]|uniref:Xylanolytic transcriptional activator regulatory domain-containing protein n=1 Tax=Curvularia clavata TaxID=95742 RepID=A0A9Q8Z120_CURCL|nr:hypothetical protein yc1106_01401 [Curvularia clavata]